VGLAVVRTYSGMPPLLLITRNISSSNDIGSYTRFCEQEQLVNLILPPALLQMNMMLAVRNIWNKKDDIIDIPSL